MSACMDKRITVCEYVRERERERERKREKEREREREIARRGCVHLCELKSQRICVRRWIKETLCVCEWKRFYIRLLAKEKERKKERKWEKMYMCICMG